MCRVLHLLSEISILAMSKRSRAYASRRLVQLRGVGNLRYVVLADQCLSHNYHSKDQGGCVSTAEELGQ